MRIAMLSWESLHSVAVGGVAAHVTELAAALQRRGHEVHIFTRRARGQSAHECVYGVHYHRCQYPAHSEFVENVNNMCRAMVDRFFDIEDFVGHFDVVHAHDWLAANAMIWIKQGRGHRCILTIHSTEYGRCGNTFPGGRSIRVRAQERAGTYWADRVVGVSHATKKEIQWMYEVPEAKVSVVYNGVSPHRFSGEVDPGGIKRRYDIGPTDPTVLFCGRLVWQKGPDLLVEAIPSILKYYPRAKFVFAGDGEMRSAVEARAKRLGILPAARFLGVRGGEELVDLFKMSEVVCVPSRNEPFGIVVLEAWSACKPVVVTQNGGPDEFVQHEYTGLKIKDQPDSIAWGLGTMFMDFDRARWMGQNGRQEVERRFTWEHVCGQTLRVYALANPDAGPLPEETDEAAPASADFEQTADSESRDAQAADEEAEVGAQEIGSSLVSDSGSSAGFLEPTEANLARLASGEPVEVALTGASLPIDVVPGMPVGSAAQGDSAALQIHVSAKLSWKPRSAGESVADVLASCKRVLADSGLQVWFHGRAAKVEGTWNQVVEAITRCFQLVDRTGQSQIVATIMPPAAPLGQAGDPGAIQIPHRTPQETRMTTDLRAAS